jgi:hypothetical protein
VSITAEEDSAPSITPLGSNNVWYTGTFPGNSSRWIRGIWPASVLDSDPSGVCDMTAGFGSQPLQGPSVAPDRNVWDQCDPDGAAQQWSFNVDTTGIASGVVPYALSAENAAGVWVSGLSENLLVDNQPVALSLSGPTVASTTSGTQYVTARASTGPSGAAIGCSVDGGAEQWHNGAIDQIPVAGAGNHVISCQARNGAIDPTGQYAYSAAQTWRLDIGEPTVSAISFTKIIDALRCGRVRKRITVPARWVTVRRHHKLVKVHRRAHTKSVSVERCHARVAWRRETVWVKVHRHRKAVTVRRTKRVRVLLTPHTVAKTKERVRYGRGVTVSGWVGTAGGVAIGGVPVEVLAAPNNGLGQFALAATATTAANGSWGARLGPGPSRLVEVAYAGSPTLLPAISPAVQTVVPATVRIKITPRIVPWRSEIRITGRVLGGYVPASSNLLRLNVGIGRIGHLEGLPEIQLDGHFVIVWKFDPGRGVLHPWFSVGTLAESAFPYAPGTSQRIVVTLGEPTPHTIKHHHHPGRPHRKDKRRKRHTRR